MKSLLKILLIPLLWFPAGRPGHAQEPDTLRVFHMQEFHRRNGLPNVFHKIAHRRQVRIGYIGGSITEAGEGWRDLSFSWFRLTFPYTAFYQTDAAIGGTGSDLGVFRIERDLLVHRPDLIFVEFAVNDGGKSREETLDTMEGLIRKIRKQDPETDICLIYTTAEVYCTELVHGRQHPAPLAMEELAEHYAIPSIHVGMEIARLHARKKLLLSADPSENAHTIVFTRDHTHPLPESGHPLYGHIVAKYLAEMQTTRAVVRHPLPRPLQPSNWQDATFVNLSQAVMRGKWTRLTAGDERYDRFHKNFPSLYRAEPGATLEFNFRGVWLGFYDCIGPESGSIAVTVDGKRQTVTRFDQWCNGYRRHSFMLEPLPDGLHRVRVEVLDTPVDKAGILRLKNISIDDPAGYDGLNWFPANILIVGKGIE
ncbi:MAG: SGNH/GDSL hydrolase family protein [Tannerella sp.]|nr:SGNH/GDSL hydrolase family protein [Tannerella sp.]